jgi:Dolichyl-phosphate-mannose-protein mannosyltransferase
MRKTSWFILVLALLKFALPFILQHSIYEPHRDELLYLAEGRHPAWGFMEVPPVLSIFAWLTHAFGDSIFWIKCWPSLVGALTFVFAANIAVSLGGKFFSIFLTWLPFIFGVFLRIHFLFQPNFLEAFFWTLMAFALVRYIQTNNHRFLYLFGIATGLSGLSKYSFAMFFVALMVGLLLNGPRKIFTNRHFLFALVIAGLMMLPNIIWQYHYGFPVLHHMEELRDTQLLKISATSFLIDQLLMNLPGVFVWIAGLVFLLAKKQGRPFRFLGIAYLVLIVILLLAHGKNYYALPIYPSLFGFGGYFLESITERRAYWTRFAMTLFCLGTGYYLIPIGLPVSEPATLAAWYQRHHIDKTGALKWEDQDNHALPQDFADMLSWKEMAQKVGAAYATLSPQEKQRTIVYCDNYGQCGAVNFYGAAYNLPPAHSINASFLYWMPDKPDYDNIVLLTDDSGDFEKPFIKQFQQAMKFDSITNPYARERGDLILILKGANDDFKKFYQNRITEHKYWLKSH